MNPSCSAGGDPVSCRKRRVCRNRGRERGILGRNNTTSGFRASVGDRTVTGSLGVGLTRLALLTASPFAFETLRVSLCSPRWLPSVSLTASAVCSRVQTTRSHGSRDFVPRYSLSRSHATSLPTGSDAGDPARLTSFVSLAPRFAAHGFRRLLTGANHPFAWSEGLRPSLFTVEVASDLAPYGDKRWRSRGNSLAASCSRVQSTRSLAWRVAPRPARCPRSTATVSPTGSTVVDLAGREQPLECCRGRVPSSRVARHPGRSRRAAACRI